MRRYLLLFLFVATLTAGCFDSLDKTTIKCSATDHCPKGYFCAEAPGVSEGFCQKGAAGLDSGADMVVAVDGTSGVDGANGIDGNVTRDTGTDGTPIVKVDADAIADVGVALDVATVASDGGAPPIDADVDAPMPAPDATENKLDAPVDLSSSNNASDGGPDLAMPGKTQGSSCSLAAECASGFCADGYCCDKACDTACWSCNLLGKEGKCSAEANGSSCGANAVCKAGTCNSCVQDQPCNTTTLCQVWKIDCSTGTSTCTKRGDLPFNTSCGTASCSGNTKTTAGSCNGSGTCNPGSAITCPTGCNGSDCAALYEDGHVCSTDFQCAGGACGESRGAGVCNKNAGTKGYPCRLADKCIDPLLYCKNDGFTMTCVDCGSESGMACCYNGTCQGTGLYCASNNYCAACGTNSSNSTGCCPGSPPYCLSGYQCVGADCLGTAGTACDMYRGCAPGYSCQGGTCQ